METQTSEEAALPSQCCWDWGHLEADSRHWDLLRPLEQSIPPRGPSEARVTPKGTGDHQEEMQGSAACLIQVPSLRAPFGWQIELPGVAGPGETGADPGVTPSQNQPLG